jgi:hypothetical protein
MIELANGARVAHDDYLRTPDRVRPAELYRVIDTCSWEGDETVLIEDCVTLDTRWATARELERLVPVERSNAAGG